MLILDILIGQIGNMFFGRSKNKIKNPYTLSNFYPEYIDWIDGKELYTLRQADFVNIISDFNKVVVEKLLEGKEFQMPAGMGRLKILKSKDGRPRISKSAIDWAATNKIGKVVYFVNKHSNGYRYKIKWEISQAGANSSKYYLIPCRDFKRNLAKVIKERKTDFYQSS